jgi:pimeloyl-ACP methyl ester carboxylesterase
MLIGNSQMSMADPISRYIRKSSGADTVIVFVHGIMGDGLSTWTSENNTYWPELLTTDHTFDGADIFVYSYPTGFWATLSIDELAEHMRSVLLADGVSNYQKIVFLSHSMGGLVTRAYLLKNRNVAKNTFFAYFFSTPTTGSQIASIVQYLSSNPQFLKMKSLNAEDYLADLLRQWLAASFSFPSYCAYEKRATKGVSLVVNMDSAVALCTKAVDPVDADHIGIVKPTSQNSASYIAFKAAYADAKIPELKTLLDNKESVRLQAAVEELAKFPNGPEISAPQGLLESMIVNKFPHRLFDLLQQYNKPTIQGIAKTGEALYDYKQEYYNFRTKELTWETNLTTHIGQMVSVRFRQAWIIYLRYVILRAAGQSKDQVIAGGDFVNYGITWDDAERVFTELSGEPTVAQEASEVFSLLNKMSDEAAKITGAL